MDIFNTRRKKSGLTWSMGVTDRNNLYLKTPVGDEKKELPPVLPLGTNRRGISKAAHGAALLSELSTESKKARPLNNKMANADTLDGAGVNSGNALDAAKLQNNSETTKDLVKKSTATVESQNTNLIARANSSSPEIWRIKGF